MSSSETLTTMMAHKHTAKQETPNPNLMQKLSLHPKTSVSELQMRHLLPTRWSKTTANITLLTTAACFPVTEYHQETFAWPQAIITLCRVSDSAPGEPRSLLSLLCSVPSEAEICCRDAAALKNTHTHTRWCNFLQWLTHIRLLLLGLMWQECVSVYSCVCVCERENYSAWVC